MGCTEKHREDKGVVHAGFTSNTAFVHNNFNETMPPVRFFMCNSSLSSEEKNIFFNNGAALAM